MHSASTRFNGITLFTFSVLGVLCLMNFAQGYFEFRPNAEVELQIESITNFVRQPKWDQASFKYSLRASTLPNTQICRRCTPGTSNNCSSTSKASGPIPSPTTILTDFLLELPLDPRNRTQQRQHWMIEVQNQRMDYLLRDVYHNLRGTTLKLSLNVEYMPIVGFFFKSEYKMPEKYTNQGLK